MIFYEYWANNREVSISRVFSDHPSRKTSDVSRIVKMLGDVKLYIVCLFIDIHYQTPK